MIVYELTSYNRKYSRRSLPKRPKEIGTILSTVKNLRSTISNAANFTRYENP